MELGHFLACGWLCTLSSGELSEVLVGSSHTKQMSVTLTNEDLHALVEAIASTRSLNSSGKLIWEGTRGRGIEISVPGDEVGRIAYFMTREWVILIR